MNKKKKIVLILLTVILLIVVMKIYYLYRDAPSRFISIWSSYSTLVSYLNASNEINGQYPKDKEEIKNCLVFEVIDINNLKYPTEYPYLFYDMENRWYGNRYGRFYAFKNSIGCHFIESGKIPTIQWAPGAVLYSASPEERHVPSDFISSSRNYSALVSYLNAYKGKNGQYPKNKKDIKSCPVFKIIDIDNLIYPAEEPYLFCDRENAWYGEHYGRFYAFKEGDKCYFTKDGTKPTIELPLGKNKSK